MNRRGPWLPFLATAATLVALTIVVVVVARNLAPGETVNWADLAAVALSAVVIVASVTGWARRTAQPRVALPDQLGAAKQTLTDLVAQQWRAESLVRSLGDPTPIPVSWHLTEDPALMDHPHLVGRLPFSFSGVSDQIPEFAEDFLALHRRRLVISGDAGSGKTTLAVQLLLELTRPDRRPVEQVPVLLPIAGWDTTVSPRLQDWLAVRLGQDYPALSAPEFGPGAARALVDRGHILPILDGLDELPEPSRAATVSRLAGSLAEGDGLVLTTRTRELAGAVRQAGDVLPGAAVIVPAPITPAIAAGYLRDCLPPRPQHDWEPALDRLRRRQKPGLAEVASTALGLWLIRAVYIATVTDPAPLIGPLGDDPARLRTQLLDQLIPAAITNRPPSTDPTDHFRPRHTWNPDQARHHLTYLARLLTTHNTRDLAWWRLAEHALTPVQKRHATTRFGLVAGLGFGVGFGLMAWAELFFTGIVAAPVLGLMSGLIAGLTGKIVSRRWFTEEPGYVELRFRTLKKHSARRFWAGSVLGLVLGLVTGLVTGLTEGLLDNDIGLGIELGLMYGLLFGPPFGFVGAVVSGLLRWMEQPAAVATATTPTSTWNTDRTLTLFRVILAGLMVGLMVGSIAWFTDGLITEFMDRFGFVIGFVGGAVVGLMGGKHHAWTAYSVVARRLAKSGNTPRNLMAFLDDAHRLGLLRAVGSIYQFRHAELQDHLAALPPSED